MMALNNDGISTGGYAPGFVEEWLAEKISRKEIKKELFSGLKFTTEHKQVFLEKVHRFE